eukprot:GGOE01044308.1.p1 GENE.GGOE01044308.1~~GGOE01044308.1.p1  ORF type:complete len:501 (-),score=150.02 GGOE01044308.1:536-2038(-)
MWAPRARFLTALSPLLGGGVPAACRLPRPINQSSWPRPFAVRPQPCLPNTKHREPIRAFANAGTEGEHTSAQPQSMALRIHRCDLGLATLTRSEAIAEIRTKHGVKMSKRSARIVENVARRDTISAIQLRNGYILLKVEYIKCIVLPDRVYLFDAQMPLVAQFAQKLRTGLQGHADEHLPFLLRCIDIALEAITADYERRLTVFQPVLNAVLASSGLAAHQTSHPALLRLLPLQNALMNFSVTVNEFLSAVRDLSDSNQSLWDTLMPGYYPEVKLIAESYVKITEELVNEVTQFQRRIDATRATIEAALDIQRNNILNLNVHISIAALTTAIGALVASIFGMNLINGFEQHSHAFPITVSCILLLCSGAYGFLLTFFFTRLRAPKSLHAIIASSDFYGRLNEQRFINALHETTSRAQWCNVLQLAVGKRLMAEEMAEVLMTQHSRTQPKTMLGCEHYDLNHKISSSEVEQVERFFGPELEPHEVEKLLDSVANLQPKGKP